MTPDSDQKLNEDKIKGDICFAIMPISDHADYEPGHFNRVYEYIIEPACLDAGFKADRADKDTAANLIHVGILDRIVSAPMAICDLSSRNPNVFFEFGIRQAFNLPVVVIKDDKTPRVFDTGIIRTLDYSKSLRVDDVNDARLALATSLNTTRAACKEGKGVNSIIEMMSLTEAAKIPSAQGSAEEVKWNIVQKRLDGVEALIRGLVSDLGRAAKSKAHIPVEVYELRRRYKELSNAPDSEERTLALKEFADHASNIAESFPDVEEAQQLLRDIMFDFITAEH